MFFDRHLMAARPQSIHYVLANRPFKQNLTTSFPVPARRIQACLRIEAVIERVDDHLDVPLRLHMPAHHPEGSDRLSLVRQEAGDDRVERSLAGRKLVRMAILQNKPIPTIVQRDASPRHYDS